MIAVDSDRSLLRHALATVAYRGGKALRDAPVEFSTFRIRPGTRTPTEILAHVSDVLEWAIHLVGGEHVWRDSAPLGWPEEMARFYSSLELLDERLAEPQPLGFEPARLFQGPIADTLEHIGQIAMLRRLTGSPVRGENYFKADIATGRVGPEQSPPNREFD